MMKTTFALFTVLLFINVESFAQCKESVDIDKLDGTKRYTYTETIFTDFITKVKIDFYSSPKLKYMVIDYVESGIRGFVIGKTDKTTIKFDDNSTLELFPYNTYSSDFTSSQRETTIRPLYFLTDEQAKILSSKNIILIRINTVKSYIDIEPKEKTAIKCKECAAIAWE